LTLSYNYVIRSRRWALWKHNVTESWHHEFENFVQESFIDFIGTKYKTVWPTEAWVQLLQNFVQFYWLFRPWILRVFKRQCDRFYRQNPLLQFLLIGNCLLTASKQQIFLFEYYRRLGSSDTNCLPSRLRLLFHGILKAGSRIRNARKGNCPRENSAVWPEFILTLRGSIFAHNGHLTHELWFLLPEPPFCA
jgi:hypothetical protein